VALDAGSATDLAGAPPHPAIVATAKEAAIIPAERPFRRESTTPCMMKVTATHPLTINDIDSSVRMNAIKVC
jgi:hypothetical protein